MTDCSRPLDAARVDEALEEPRSALHAAAASLDTDAERTRMVSAIDDALRRFRTGISPR